jgi:5'-3' exonuclease
MNNRVLNLIEISWPQDAIYNKDLPAAKSYKESNKIKPNEPVFVYGNYDICEHVNRANENKVRQYFGLSIEEKNLRRANAHITAIIKKDGSSQYNTDRMNDILRMNNNIVQFFLKQLHNLIRNLGISTNDFIILCYLIGNDFMPGLLTTDVKKGGLDKIFTAYDNLLNKLKINRFDESNNIKSNLLDKEENKEENNNKYKINDVLLIELFKEILWTERYVWKNINRENNNKQNNEKNERNNDRNNNNNFNNNFNSIDEIKIHQERKELEKISNMNKFKLGLSHNTNFLEKIEFNSDLEYYSYYLGIECISIDRLIIIKMVKDYITTMQWCINYYLDDCKSWSWGYNYMVAPLIKDIIKYYPKEIEIIPKKRELNPVEQLILAIPPYTYKFVIEKDIIKKIQNEKDIGYMFPESFDIDVNKEMIYWKCHVKIPMVEYDEYIKSIKLINIINSKNLIIKNK